MKTSILHVILALFVFFSTGCKKSPVITPPSNAADSYLPVTAGSHWAYHDVIGGFADTINIKMTGLTTNINGTTFYTATGSSHFNSAITENFYIANHLYIERYFVGGGIYQTNIDIVLLNDTVSAGNSFTAVVTPIGGAGTSPERIINTVIEKNVSKVVGGKTFSNVIHTRIGLQYNFGTGFETNSVYDYYLAKGTGIIEEDISAPDGTVSETLTIMDYGIN